MIYYFLLEEFTKQSLSKIVKPLILLWKVYLPFVQAISNLSFSYTAVQYVGVHTDGQNSRFLPGFAICDCQDTVKIIG